MTAGESLSDKNRLLFGAGFVFGVMFTLVVLAVATVAVAGRTEGSPAGDILVTIAAGVLFAGIVGTVLYLFAFPENRVDVPVERLFGSDDEER